MTRSGLVRTALFEEHASSDAKMVDFLGYELPIWYTSIQEEHLATRSAAGLFDVSHMGVFRFSGRGVRSWLSSISTQEYMKFGPGRCGYTHFLDDNGHIIDDMIFSVVSEGEVIGVPNSSMVPTMLEWFESHMPNDGSIFLEDLSDHTSILALQGPASMSIISDVLGESNLVRRFHCQPISQNDLEIKGWIQGTGYTGERGAEIFVDNELAPELWRAILGHSESGVVPVGLGARDTLRLEKGYLLSGQDFLWPGMGGEASPDLPSGFLSRNTVETSVTYGLEMNHDFLGKDQMIASMDSGQRWWGLACLERGPSPRPGHAVMDGPDDDARIVGYVTSGAPSPSLGMSGIAMAYLDGAEEGSEVWIQSSTRRRIRAAVKRPPFI
jgi:aminomethyltransferase